MTPFHRPSTPGEILKAGYLDDHCITIGDFAAQIGVTREHLSRFCNGHVRLTADMAARIAEHVGTMRHWLALQAAVDEWDATHKAA